jgi:hypothetical protein
MEYYHFTLYDANFMPKNLLVPTDKFRVGRMNDLQTLENNRSVNKSKHPNSNYDVVVDIVFEQIDKGCWQQAKTEITRIYNELFSYANDLHHEYRFFEQEDGKLGNEMNLHFIKESDSLWWNEDVINLNLDYRDIHDIDKIKSMASEKGIKIVKTYLFQEMYISLQRGDKN